MNTVLGALEPNGEDWCYFTFPNGRRNPTYHWACCKSSGALALEESALAAVTPYRDGVSVNLFSSFLAEVVVDDTRVEVTLEDDCLSIRAERPVRFPVYIRQPDWGELDVEGDSLFEHRFCRVEREWNDDSLRLASHAPVQVHTKTHTVDHHGQEIVRTDYAYVSRGALVYATGLIDGYKKQETLRLPRLNPESVFRESSDSRIELCLPAREPIPFAPYSQGGNWRTTWLQVAWQ
jgi:DUF1680 family protein